ncbi:hypothetical protein SAMN04489860_0214 [Paraoerskovia marina]|uniref:Uncharacterized protein n=1 Tax=Paraoerskovia marina TaxID=545619 RepID=A0A1H1ME72_9CELL|nr:hypothetical protein [Paraoerskovia marina]SDR85103.1 hypothetical protein SAMN04489860_0214 [Paraoerskovia marina]
MQHPAISPDEQVLPGLYIRPGRFDPAALLFLRVFRRAVWPLLFIGAAIAWVSGEFTAQSLERLTSPAEFLGAILSPLVTLAVAIALRIVVNFLGLLLATPLARSAWVPGHEARTWGKRMYDLGYLSSGYRAVRWSWAVQAEAVHRLGSVGLQLAFVELLGRILTPIAAAGFVLVVIFYH